MELKVKMQRTTLVPLMTAAVFLAGCTAGPPSQTEGHATPIATREGSRTLHADEIWNRALDYDYKGPRGEGDRALYDLLMLDNVAQNGGLLHGIQVLEPRELTAAVAGYRWFGLDALSDGVESVASEASGIDFEDPSTLPAQEDLEVRADDIYFGEQGSELFDAAFKEKLAERPDAFSDAEPFGQ
ncbi:hypothetical protein [Arthrobacter sp. NPDC089319]|uniref:hypothetical protein n=1 Tax=Arthrobacter sp. NPDC089319 TaxID=3155915 RepID=UPI00344023CC